MMRPGAGTGAGTGTPLALSLNVFSWVLLLFRLLVSPARLAVMVLLAQCFWSSKPV
jgi:hypothetical protein